MTGMRFTSKGYGGHRRNPDEVKRDGWKEQRMLAVSNLMINRKLYLARARARPSAWREALWEAPRSPGGAA